MTHDWRETGEQDVHCDFPTKTQGHRVLYAVYVRCERCEQRGFRKPGSPVVYTWNTEGP